MDINSAYAGGWLKAVDLPQGQDTQVQISHIAMEEVGQDHKPVVYFLGHEKGLVLNKTNASTIQAIYGPETDFWTNQWISIGRTWTDFQGKQVEAIRVRPGPNQQLQQPPAQPPQGMGQQPYPGQQQPGPQQMQPPPVQQPVQQQNSGMQQPPGPNPPPVDSDDIPF